MRPEFGAMAPQGPRAQASKDCGGPSAILHDEPLRRRMGQSRATTLRSMASRGRLQRCGNRSRMRGRNAVAYDNSFPESISFPSQASELAPDLPRCSTYHLASAHP